MNYEVRSYDSLGVFNAAILNHFCPLAELTFGHYPFIIPVSFVLLILDKSYLLLSSNHDFSIA